MSDNENLKKEKKKRKKQSHKKENGKKTANRKTSIRGRLQFDISILIGVSVAVLAIVSLVSSCVNNMFTLRENMMTLAQLTADRVSEELKVTTSVVSELGMESKLSNNVYVKEQKQSLIDQRVESYGMVSGKLLDEKGMCKMEGVDYSQTDYFKKSMQGETVISDPITDEDGTQYVVISAPVWKDGVKDSSVVGVVLLIPNPDFLNNVAVGVKISKNAECYMLDATGSTIAQSYEPDASEVKNVIEAADTDASLKKLASLEQKMIQGENGYGVYTEKGSVKIMAYAPIADTNGWSVALNAPIMDFLSTACVGMGISIVIAIGAVLLGISYARTLGKQIGTPIKLCADRLALLSTGNLHAPMPEINTQDETKKLADATAVLADNLKLVITDADSLLGEMADGNFAISADNEQYYVGDFHGLIESMRKLNFKLSATLSDIKEAVGQVTLGAGQMAETAQGLAEGATEQAGAVEELQATITNMTEIVEKNTKNLQESSEKAKTYQRQAQLSGQDLNGLTSAMKSIDETSRQINDIIGEIEDIASQTNLLSLNAAIEAARAGEAGRGFAVVADQIRKLADDSAQSAVHTRELIETAIQKIEEGNEITAKACDSLIQVVDGIGIIAEDSRKAADSATAQAEAMEQLEQGIDQISAVVQNNSATAEESSATSEELSAQATNMNELVEAFKLRPRK